MQMNLNNYSRGLLALPVLWGLGLVLLFGVNVVFWDEWRIVELLQEFRDSGFDLAALFRLHNEHRIVLPRVLLMLSAVGTDYNTRIQMLLNQAAMLVVYLVHLAYLRQVATGRRNPGGQNSSWMLGVALLVGLVCYHAKQYENFLWAFQLGFLMAFMFAVLGLFCFARAANGGGWKWLVGTVLAGFAATLSCIQGLLVWPVYALLLAWLWLAGSKPSGRFIFWVMACGALAWGTYWIGYQKPSGHPAYLAGGLVPAAAYFFAALGSIVAARQAPLAVALGVGVFVGAGALGWHLQRHRKIRANLYPAGLVLFSFAVAASLAIGRAGLEDGVAGAMTSRYASFNLATFIGLLLIAYREFPNETPTQAGAVRLWRLGAGLIGLCGIWLFLTNLAYLQPCRRWRDARLADVKTIKNAASADWEALKRVGPFTDREEALESIHILEENEWNVFSK